MRTLILRLFSLSLICFLVVATAAQAQSDAPTLFKANCVLCHAADGSGNTSAGKALKAKDLRSPEVQKQSDAVLVDTITKGKGKMPAFGNKINPDGVKSLVAYVRGLKK
jgi:mono/diheme cytochrome c family protein